MVIFGLTGLNGSGKGTVADYLVSKYGFRHYSVGDYILEEMARRGLANERKNMVLVANDLRQKYGAGYIVEQLINKAKQIGGDGAIVESIRTIGEIELLKSLGCYVLGVGADRKLRYERILKRGSFKDNKTYEQFVEEEELEMNSEDPSKQNLEKCYMLADYKVDNNKDKNYLFQQLDEIIKKI